MKGICQIPLIPCRAEDSDKSEMVNQLLFGETYSVIEEREKWVKIISDIDLYECWISKNQHSVLDKIPENRKVVNRKFLKVNSNETSMLIPAGSFIDTEDNSSSFKKVWVSEGSIEILGFESLENLSKAFLNTPYLWGGKSFMGIDCSGFTQVIFRCVGLNLPRDAWQQEKEGKTVNFGEQVKGDLAFFCNSQQRVTHVGILLNEKDIIHASGMVRIDIFDRFGIKHSESGIGTHQLFSIKRYF